MLSVSYRCMAVGSQLLALLQIYNKDSVIMGRMQFVKQATGSAGSGDSLSVAMQAELDKKNIVLKSISDRINPDVQNISPPRIEGHCEGKSAHKKRKRDKSNAQHEKAEDSAARKGSHKCGPSAYCASLSSMPVLWVLGTW
jgi:hypothetical protein